MSILSTYQSTFDTNDQENFQFMKQMVIKGLKRKGVYEDTWYQDRLEEELEVIHDCQLEDFFLQTAYICALIDDAGIFRGPARGSCLASVICYGLNITKIPPKEYNLSFARFLNKTRAMTQLPDIDVDVSSSDRDDVLQLIKNTFGEDRCGQVLTKTPYSPKMLIKDLSARQGIDFQEVNLLTRQLDSDEDYKQISRDFEDSVIDYAIENDEVHVWDKGDYYVDEFGYED